MSNKNGAVKWGKRGIYLLFMIIFVVYFVFAGQIVSALYYGDERPHKLSGSIDALLVSAEAHGWVTKVEYLGGVTEEVVIEGFAFCDTEAVRNGEKTVHMLLQSDKGTYDVEAAPVNSATTLPEVQAEYSLSGPDIAFIGIFTSLPVPNGEYHLYVYVQEGTDISGLLDTGTNILVEEGSVRDPDADTSVEEAPSGDADLD